MTIAAPTPAEIKAFYSTALSEGVVQVYIDDAVLVLEEVASVVAATEAKQKAIVRWVTLHMLQLSSSGAVTSEALGDASKGYVGPVLGLGLSSTVYGQRALLLDPNLAIIGKQRSYFEVV